MLCGLLCAPTAEPATLWLREALGRAPEEVPPPPLDQLFRETLRGIDDSDFGFEILLPDEEDADLDERTAALAQWCSGLIYGLGVGGLDPATLDAEGNEFLADVNEVARVDPASAAQADEGEAALVEIVEYLRMGTIALRTAAGHASAS